MSKRITFFCAILFAFILIFSACKKDPPPTPTPVEEPDLLEPPVGTSKIDATPQRPGNAGVGYEYLVTGNYLDSGIPYDLYVSVQGTDPSNELGRTGNNANLSHGLSAVEAFNGVEVVVANCLQCHAGRFQGDLVMGLGNSRFDFTQDQSGDIGLLDIGIQTLYGANSPEWEAYLPFRRGVVATGPNVVTPVRGANASDKIAGILAAHRDKDDLTWMDDPQYPIPSEVIPSDVPAWWLLKKKNAMYYTGSGRGDFARLMMASSLLTLQDTVKAREVDEQFADVVAFINSIEVPNYPESIDFDKVARGETLYTNNCAKCHGTYGADETYPNLLVEMSVIKTDPMLAQTNFSNIDFVNLYNTGWFAQPPFAAQLEPTNGYIAPPLDGVWVTAPYLHNGSVPTLEDLLDSSQRPTYFQRNFSSHAYDFDKVGIEYEVMTSGGGTDVYDTTLPGYSNVGHTFGDSFSAEERSDLIEYLKTL